MKNLKGAICWEAVAILLLCSSVVLLVISVAVKQDNDKKRFMDGCLQDKRQYECDVLWAQTDESKQMRDVAIGIAAGVAIGAAAGRK